MLPLPVRGERGGVRGKMQEARGNRQGGLEKLTAVNFLNRGRFSSRQAAQVCLPFGEKEGRSVIPELRSNVWNPDLHSPCTALGGKAGVFNYAIDIMSP